VQTQGNIDGALLNYNHSMSYVNSVKTIAYEIGCKIKLI